MTVGNTSNRPSATVRAEAAAWIARLQGPNRTTEVEHGLRQWLAESPAHASAFERLTDTWEKSARLSRRPAERISNWDLGGVRLSFSKAALAMAACFAFATIATLLYLHSDAITTEVGELRTVTLEDGTRVHLNTATRVRVHYDRSRRGVTLEKGEAIFEVAHRADWPFIVTASGQQIRALGTQFVVRTSEQNLIVTLIQGKVDVAPVRASRSNADSVPSAALSGRTTDTAHVDRFTMSPGERLTFVQAQAPRIDWPAMNGVTAWEHGQVAFDDMPLAEAVAEMNRYSRQRIVFADPALASVRLSGIFATGDSSSFAQAVAHNYHFRVAEGADLITLSAQDEAGLAGPSR